MAERLQPHKDGIIRRSEDLPENITYEDLIQKVGGKAAGLLWIQKHLPEIPQARMIVAPPGTDSQEIIAAAQQEGLKLPWLIRASTPVDNLPGFENAFSTQEYEGSYGQVDSEAVDYIEEVKVMGIRHAPQPVSFRETSVIIAEQSESRTNGTLIAHPHRADIKLAGITRFKWPIDPKAFYCIHEGKAHFWKRWSKTFGSREKLNTHHGEIEQISSWYDQIVTLPGFSSEMTYQLEFGLNPLLLFQTRDFLPVQKANFTLDKDPKERKKQSQRPMVFGITPPEGINVTIYNYHEQSEKEDAGSGPLQVFKQPQELKGNDSVAVLCTPYDTPYITFPRRANIFHSALGILTHDDIRQMRTSELTVIYSMDEIYSRTGEKFNIVSDGVRIKVSKLE